MTLAAKLRRAPGRLVAGSFILNAGLSKLNGDDDQAKALHGMAAGAFPPLEKVPPKPFLKALAIGEITLGGALLMPFVPAGLAGLGLTAFSGSLLTMWWRTPGMHGEGTPRPTQQGTTIAKDVWMLGIGTGLVVDAALSESPLLGEQARAEAKANLKADAKLARRSAGHAVTEARRQGRAFRREANRQAKALRRQAEHVLPG
jgi:hypothetical protein